MVNRSMLRLKIKIKILTLILILIFPAYNSYASSNYQRKEIWVVSRETGSLFIIDRYERIVKQIPDIGDLRHAVIKFKDNSAFILTRDGYIVKIENGSVKNKLKVGDSSVGFDFSNDIIAVANYEPKSVVLINSNDMKIIKQIQTSSRTVGIKSYKDKDGDKIIFSLMDKGQIWIYNLKDGKIKKINVGGIIFDALLHSKKYIIGLFEENFLGILDMGTYDFIRFELKATRDILKIPHFGTWGKDSKKAYIPALGLKKVFILNIENISLDGEIELIGKPIFVVSNGSGKIAVNYSDQEDFISFVEVEKGTIKNIKAGKRIMHLRFISENELAISSYFEDKVKIVDVKDGKIIEEFNIPYPSGIFLKVENFWRKTSFNPNEITSKVNFFTYFCRNF